MPNSSSEADGIIRVMPDSLANKIAAGEVVQRPASVAKELMENALDAGAQSIQLLLKNAGSTLVQVIDDGCGMSQADAERCFQRHATSKIQSVKDLERIQTLGFRGEALASIASVAQVELKTKRMEDEAGHRVVVEGGTRTAVEPCAAPDGTSIAVRNLFYNVPARRNFLKTPATELKHLTQTFQFLSLSNPDVAFRLIHNGNTLYDLTPGSSGESPDLLRRRVVDLMGTDWEGHLVPVTDASSYLKVRGLIGQPERTRKTRGEQFLFVNGRYVESRYLSHAVRAAYGDMIPDGAFPLFTLFLRLDPRRVDVNVHPTKAEVKFDDQSGVYGFLRTAVRRALASADLTPQFAAAPEDAAGAGSPPQASPPSFQATPQTPTKRRSVDFPDQAQRLEAPDSRTDARRSGPPRPLSPRRLPNGRSPGDASEALYRPPEQRPDRQRHPSSDEAAAQGASRRTAPGGPIWALHDHVLLVPIAEGLLMVDQRAAHERVLYEQALRALEEERGESQQLLFPHTVELPPSDVEVFEEAMPSLRALGFDMGRLSGRTVTVRGLPPGTAEDDVQSVIEDLLEEYKAMGTVGKGRNKQLAKALAQRNAVRRGDALSASEQRGLLDDLFACEMPYADARGNPTLVRLSMDELTKQLGR